MRRTGTSSPRPFAPRTPRVSAVLTHTFRSLAVVAVLTAPSLAGLGGVDGGRTAAPESPFVESPSGSPSGASPGPVWKADYSRRFPGCVPAVLWPADEKPVAVLTRTPDGRVDRVALDTQRRLVRPLPAATRTIGACR